MEHKQRRAGKEKRDAQLIGPQTRAVPAAQRKSFRNAAP
jgi:hypothetical protein